MTRAVVALTALALVACHHSDDTPALPTSRDGAREAFTRCMFDRPPAPRDEASMEADVRHALRDDRIAFSVRAGRCALVLESLRMSDPTIAAFARAWEELLPLAQASAPDDILLEQSVRHVGLAYRGW